MLCTCSPIQWTAAAIQVQCCAVLAGLYDMVQLRIPPEQWIGPNMYKRGDGTLAYFFSVQVRGPPWTSTEQLVSASSGTDRFSKVEIKAPASFLLRSIAVRGILLSSASFYYSVQLC